MATKRKSTTPARRRRRSSGGGTKTVVRYRTRTAVAPRRRRRRTGFSNGGASLAMMVGQAILGGVAGVLVGRANIIQTDEKKDAMVKMAIGGAGAYLAVKQGFGPLGFGFAGGMAAKAIGSVVPQLADPGTVADGDYEETTWADATIADDDDDELSDGDLFYDEAGQPMMLNDEGEMVYLEDGTLADDEYNDPNYWQIVG